MFDLNTEMASSVTEFSVFAICHWYFVLSEKCSYYFIWKWDEAEVLAASCSGVLQHLRLIKASWSGNTACIPVLFAVVNWGIVWGAAGIDFSLLRFYPHLMFMCTSCSGVSFGFSDTFTHQCYCSSGCGSDIWALCRCLFLLECWQWTCPDEFC